MNEEEIKEVKRRISDVEQDILFNARRLEFYQTQLSNSTLLLQSLQKVLEDLTTE